MRDLWYNEKLKCDMTMRSTIICLIKILKVSCEQPIDWNDYLELWVLYFDENHFETEVFLWIHSDKSIVPHGRS